MSSRRQQRATTRAQRVPAQPSSEQTGLLRRVPAILYIADPGQSGVWHYVSPQIEWILGFSSEEWCADPELWADRLHPDDRARVILTETGILQGAASSGAYEYRLVHRDGSIVWVRDDALLIEDEDGETRWHGVMSDITEQKEAEAELERRAAQQAAVARLGEHALEGASTSDLMAEAVRATAQLLELEIAAVLELVPGGDAFLFRSTLGLPDTTGMKLPADTASQAGYTILSKGPVVVRDWETETRFSRSAVMGELGVRSGLTVVIEGRRAPFGVLGLHSPEVREFRPEDIDFAQAIANVLGDAFERQLTDDHMRHRALHDDLTGLPNRLLFMDRLGQALERLRRRSNRLSAILFLDLDRFNLINESLGHAVGNELLAATAPRLKQAVGSSDTVARFGGDEFGILLEEVSSEQDAVDMAERIAAVFTGPFVLSGDEHFVSASIGIALGEGGERPEDVVRDADTAMYRAKERGRARYELFDERLRGRALSRLQVESDLRRALERNELTLDYQPLVSLHDFSIVGVEALIRWEHPERGRIEPADFIPVAEENGLIEPIGRWVLEHACRQAAAWHRGRPDAAPISMAVNLSAVQVSSRGLIDTVAGALRASGLDPSWLSLEVTESVMLADADADGLGDVLARLKALGVQLVLDDFGTGYSSLSYLTRLPINVLKVDRSFIDGLGTEPRDTAITEAIVAMSHALSLRVVGEGAETGLQVAELSRLGCDYVQGYHFSPPVSADAITAMLTAGPGWLTSAPRRSSHPH
ncbi:MAG: EAL domain-containing protein [Actinomycetota bacterium]|nr:EAL domain-containing protein [Actinomycetota bacterium]